MTWQLHDGRPDNDNRFLTVLFYLNDVYAGGIFVLLFVRLCLSLRAEGCVLVVLPAPSLVLARFLTC
jgi:hypothetical protein